MTYLKKLPAAGVIIAGALLDTFATTTPGIEVIGTAMVLGGIIALVVRR